ncbi:hypothetical protein GLOTRDRAFT_31727 [Gloeophyllum trabeum ATCC 11539]|uniref:SMP-LTD domain-containing protein n=1 Tax=Gloeophyllum trabeum (strain ATCC 11539 / FP-39264 / Madison 617) TaxID=670483 RepID=S7S4J2_GLOTA|nr:uncharacterized protein GLOTRDRAFT_31727 [Gloeophyllum trabeum ATCC 11539]EPQ60839.1 hypothetical protein GLOTRDRAFT_31727 [Gloeophyllum trabeum ATCC 11539]
MGSSSNYIFTLQPTFTQGLVIGQVSILLLIYFILKYLFFDATASHEHSFQPAPRKVVQVAEDGEPTSGGEAKGKGGDGEESAEWFNMLLSQVIQTYRSKLRDDLSGPEGDEVARRRIEEFANKVRPTGFLDAIKIHSVNLGSSAPKLTSARLHHPPPTAATSKSPLPQPATAHFNMTYTDSISVALSTACLFNYPFDGFARLPVSLVIELVIFESPITLTAPIPSHPSPTLTISLPPYPAPSQGFTIKLKTSSLLGSRAKLVDVPKVGELIEMQVRRLLAERGTFKVVLPGLGTVQEAKEELKKEKEMQGYA